MADPAAPDPAPASDTAAAPAPDSPYRYWAFISYSSKDESWARWLHRAIETYGVPVKAIREPTPTGEVAPPHLRPVFRDRDELPAASDLGAQIEQALSASRYLIVICSPAAAASPWVDKEIESFRRLSSPEGGVRADRILALIVEGEPNSGDETECFPPQLRAAEPLAADAREDGDGRTDAKLKLLAGMLGVGFDTLKQRDSARRIRRLQAIIAASLALAASFAGLALYANTQRIAAVDARKEAEEQKAEAVKARKQAEGLLDYLVNELSVELEPIGRLDIVANVQDRIDQYYREYGQDTGSGKADLLNRLTASQDKARRLNRQGELAGAEKEWRAALAIAQRLAVASPRDVNVQIQLAACHNGLADAVWQLGDLEAALEENRAAIAILGPIATARPKDEAALRQLMTSRGALGEIQMVRGDLDAALADLRAATEVGARVVALAPQDAELQLSYVDCLHSLGQALGRRGDHAGALGEFRTALEIVTRLAAVDTRHTGRQRELSIAHTFLGTGLAEQGDMDGALAEYRSALAIMERLSASDPTNVEWRRDQAVIRRSIGETLLERGDRPGAVVELRSSLAIAEEVSRSDPENTGWQLDLVLAHESLAEALARSRDVAGALAEYRAAESIYERLLSTDPSNADWAQGMSIVQDAIAELGSR